MTGSSEKRQRFIDDEIGAGLIREDVQEAIRRELNYRLGEGDAPGALSRWEKEILLLGINVVKPNACLSQLHSRAATKAGAKSDQVLEVTLIVFMIGMVRWRMAGLWAFNSAEEAVEQFKGSKVARRASPAEEKRLEEIRQYVWQVLHHELPVSFAKLAEVAPGVLDGYVRMRESFVKPDPLGALPKRVLELATVSLDIILANPVGAQNHTRAAIKAGATVSDVVEMVALVMIELGLPVYKTGGFEAIEAAEKATAELAGK